MSKKLNPGGLAAPLALLLCLGFSSPAGAEECRSLDTIEWVLGEWTTAPNRVVISLEGQDEHR